jgi:hypothetical protein
MSTLTSLKLTNATKPTSMPVIQQKRNKLTTKIWEQIQLAEAQASGGTYTSKRFKTITAYQDKLTLDEGSYRFYNEADEIVSFMVKRTISSKTSERKKAPELLAIYKGKK